MFLLFWAKMLPYSDVNKHFEEVTFVKKKFIDTNTLNNIIYMEKISLLLPFNTVPCTVLKYWLESN